MAKFSVFRRIVQEDFPSKYQDLMEKLAFPINQFFETVTNAMSKGIEFDENINSQLKDITIQVDDNGNPGNISFQSTKKGKAKGIICVKADNVTNASHYPTSGVMVSFYDDGGVIKVNNITGLQPRETYQLKLLVI